MKRQFFLALALCQAAVPAAAGLECAFEPRYHDGNEAALLHANKDVASRDGQVLRLKTGSGLVDLRDTDCQEGPAGECRKYELAAYWPMLGFYVVHVAHYEGGEYQIISARTGEATNLFGFPWLSPDGSRFVTATGDDPYAFFNGIEVWAMSDVPHREWSCAPPNEDGYEVSFCFQEWIGPDRVSLRGARTNGLLQGEFSSVLTHHGSGWAVDRTSR